MSLGATRPCDMPQKAFLTCDELAGPTEYQQGAMLGCTEQGQQALLAMPPEDYMQLRC